MIILNGNQVTCGNFPNGESYVDVALLNIRSNNSMEVKFETNNDLINMMFLKKHLDNQRFKTRLTLQYTPYSRMDRQNNEYAFSLKYLTEFINFLGFYQTKISEPHSDVCPALLNNCEIYNYIVTNLHKVMSAINFDKEKDFIFYPDAGAQKRYSKIKGFNVAVGYKERDFKTGDIIAYDIKYNNIPYNGKCIIIDDLCSRGGTFVEASANIKKQLNTDYIYLFVAHLENNVFNGSLLNEDSNITKIFCSDSLIFNKHSKITIV